MENTYTINKNEFNSTAKSNSICSTTLGSKIFLSMCPLLLLFGTFTNILSLLILSRKRMRKHSTYVYLAILSVIDLLALWLGISRDYLAHGYGMYIKSLWLCKLHSFLFYFTLDMSSWILVAVSVDRFLAITFVFSSYTRQLLLKLLAKPKLICSIICLSLFLLNLHLVFFVQVDFEQITNKNDLIGKKENKPNLKKHEPASTSKIDLNSKHECPSSIISNEQLPLMSMPYQFSYENRLATNNQMYSIGVAGEYYYCVIDEKRHPVYLDFFLNIWPYIDLSAYAILPFCIMFICNIAIIKNVKFSTPLSITVTAPTPPPPPSPNPFQHPNQSQNQNPNSLFSSPQKTRYSKNPKRLRRTIYKKPVQANATSIQQPTTSQNATANSIKMSFKAVKNHPYQSSMEDEDDDLKPSYKNLNRIMQVVDSNNSSAYNSSNNLKHKISNGHQTGIKYIFRGCPLCMTKYKKNDIFTDDEFDDDHKANTQHKAGYFFKSKLHLGNLNVSSPKLTRGLFSNNLKTFSSRNSLCDASNNHSKPITMIFSSSNVSSSIIAGNYHQSRNIKMMTLTIISITCIFILLTLPIMLFIVIDKIGSSDIADIVNNSTSSGLNFGQSKKSFSLYNLPALFFRMDPNCKSVLWAVVNILFYLNHCVNFVLYCLTGSKFRTELATMFISPHQYISSTLNEQTQLRYSSSIKRKSNLTNSNNHTSVRSHSIYHDSSKL